MGCVLNGVMKVGHKFAEGSFANPDVDDLVVSAIVAHFEENGKAYPWDAIKSVSESRNVPKKTVRAGIRKLRLNADLVPAEPFIGKLELKR